MTSFIIADTDDVDVVYDRDETDDAKEMKDAGLWCALVLLVLLALLAAPQSGPEPAPATARGLQELQLFVWSPDEGSVRRARARARWPGSVRVVEHPGPGPALAVHGLLDLQPHWDEMALAAVRRTSLLSHGVPGCRPCALWTPRCRVPGALMALRGSPTLRCPDPRLILTDGRLLARLVPLLSEAPGAAGLLALAARAEKRSVAPLTSLLATDPRGVDLEEVDEETLTTRAREVGAPWNFDMRGRSLVLV